MPGETEHPVAGPGADVQRLGVARWRRLVPGQRGTGLQGRLVVGFMTVTFLALAACSQVYVYSTEARVERMLGNQAVEIATTLAYTSEGAVVDGARPPLEGIAANLIRNSNIVFVGYYGPDGEPIVRRSRDPDSDLAGGAWGAAEWERFSPRSLLRVRSVPSKLFGDLYVVTAPVLTVPAPPSTTGAGGSGAEPGVAAESAEMLKASHAGTGSGRGASRLRGYVTVALSGQTESAELRRANVLVLGAGCLVAILSLPLSYYIVYRIVKPIRTLMVSTQRITAGDFDARVEIERDDAIGDLAHSFNELVGWVQHHQQRAAEANEGLARANRELEHRIEQRTAQVETANRRLSEEIAEKEDFLRAVSHDLNAPLRNISGMATMLLMKHRQKLDEEVVHRLERIKSNVDVETDLINELLELSRIKTRRQKMETVELERLVRDLRLVFEEDLRARDIGLIVDGKLPVLIGERARLRQLFQNLIDNAIKYMGSGADRRIHIGCQEREGEVEFYVRDTGMGIEADDQDKVFHVFRRGRNTASQSIAGKGIGLASVKSIVEMYNGRIWVESKPGEGSTFRFTINGRYVQGMEDTELVEAGADATFSEPESSLS